MKLISLAGMAFLAGGPAAAATMYVEFDEFAEGTAITDQYADFTVDLIGTDEDASMLFGTYSNGDSLSMLLNNALDASDGHPIEITFDTVVDDLVIEYSFINEAGGATITYSGGTTFQAMEYYGCRTTLCTADFSSYDGISSVLLSFGVGDFEDAFGIESMSYSIAGGDTQAPAVPLPASGVLLLGGLLGLALRRRG